MNIFLGNVEFSQVKNMLGYKLNDNDKELWDKYHNDKADLSGMDSCFHVFDIPRCIKFKGDDAKGAILSMFKPDKIVKQIGQFAVYEAE